jgi:hypothetical protein
VRRAAEDKRTKEQEDARAAAAALADTMDVYQTL